MKTLRWISILTAGLLAAAAGCSAQLERDGARPQGSDDPAGGNQGSTGEQVQPSLVRERCESSLHGSAVLRRLTRTELQATIEDVFPEIQASWRGVRLSADPASKLGFFNDSAALLVGFQTANEILRTAEDVAQLVTSSEVLSGVLPCASSGGEACAAEFVDRYGFRLFRRPLTEAERGEYLDLFNSVAGESSFELGIKWTLVALLQSPHTVYRSELGVSGDGQRQLTEYELATQLAYMYGGTAPDQTLLDLAAEGSLSDPAVRADQARRLIRTPRGLEVVRDFFRSWLGYESIVYDQRDEVPEFATTIAPDLVNETRLYIDQIIFQHGGDLSALMRSPFTVLNPNLSSYYGFGDVQGNKEDWAQVERPWGAGLLAQGSVLVSTAHENATSPTLRGLLVFSKLLCNDKITPPAIVPTLEDSEGKANTTRELFEQVHLTKGSGCDSCHARFDPVGFTFEHFDETGRYRADENGFPIDPSGNITLADHSEVELTGYEDLLAKVDEVSQIKDCISGLMATYMFSGGGGQVCLAEPERTALANGEIGIEEYLIALTSVPHFASRLP